MNPRLFGAYLSTVKYAAAPAAAPKAPASPTPPPQSFMSMGVPGTKKSTIINFRNLPGYVPLNNGGLPTTSNFMQEHGPSGFTTRALGAGIAGAVVNPGRLTRNIVATGLGNAVNQLANPQSAFHQGLKNLGTNPGVFSAAGAAALHPSISDEALQHGGYKAPAPGVTYQRPTPAPPPGVIYPRPTPAPPPGAGFGHGPGPKVKSSYINPRIFGAMLAQLR